VLAVVASINYKFFTLLQIATEEVSHLSYEWRHLKSLLFNQSFGVIDVLHTDRPFAAVITFGIRRLSFRELASTKLKKVEIATEFQSGSLLVMWKLWKSFWTTINKCSNTKYRPYDTLTLTQTALCFTC